MDTDNAGARQMFQGNWTCADCGGEITQLPFQPDPNRTGSLRCRDCMQKSRANRPQRQMYQGDWKCGSCSIAITELPFQPSENRLGELKCRDCFLNERQNSY